MEIASAATSGILGRLHQLFNQVCETKLAQKDTSLISAIGQQKRLPNQGVQPRVIVACSLFYLLPGKHPL